MYNNSPLDNQAPNAYHNTPPFDSMASKGKNTLHSQNVDPTGLGEHHLMDQELRANQTNLSGSPEHNHLGQTHHHTSTLDHQALGQNSALDNTLSSRVPTKDTLSDRMPGALDTEPQSHTLGQQPNPLGHDQHHHNNHKLAGAGAAAAGLAHHEMNRDGEHHNPLSHNEHHNSLDSKTHHNPLSHNEHHNSLDNKDHHNNHKLATAGAGAAAAGLAHHEMNRDGEHHNPLSHKDHHNSLDSKDHHNPLSHNEHHNSLDSKTHHNPLSHNEHHNSLDNKDHHNNHKLATAGAGAAAAGLAHHEMNRDGEHHNPLSHKDHHNSLDSKTHHNPLSHNEHHNSLDNKDHHNNHKLATAGAGAAAAGLAHHEMNRDGEHHNPLSHKDHHNSLDSKDHHNPLSHNEHHNSLDNKDHHNNHKLATAGAGAAAAGLAHHEMNRDGEHHNPLSHKDHHNSLDSKTHHNPLSHNEHHNSLDNKDHHNNHKLATAGAGAAAGTAAAAGMAHHEKNRDGEHHNPLSHKDHHNSLDSKDHHNPLSHNEHHNSLDNKDHHNNHKLATAGAGAAAGTAAAAGMAHHEKNRDKTELPSPEQAHGDKVADEMTRDAKALGVNEPAHDKHHSAGSLGSAAGATAAGAAAAAGTGAAAKHHHDKHNASVDNDLKDSVSPTENAQATGGKTGFVKDHHGKEEVVPGLGAGALGTGAVESVVKNDDGINEDTGRAMEEEEKKEAIEHKPSATEKIKGNLEKVVGKLTNNPEKVAKGEDLAHGRAL